MTCLIAGCSLIDPFNNRWAHGDLHQIGNCYVFNACLHSLTGEAAWEYNEDAPDSPALTLLSALSNSTYFERRSVIIVPADGICAELNPAAKKYLRRPL